MMRFFTMLPLGETNKEEEMEVDRRAGHTWQVAQQVKAESPASTASLAKDFFKVTNCMDTSFFLFI